MINDEIKKAEGDGIMVALMVPPDIAAQLASIALPGQEPADAMHLTLASLGKTNAFTPESLDMIKQSVASFAEQTAPVSGVISGIGVFSMDEANRVVYASFDSPALGEFRHNICAALHSAGLPIPHDHGFTPHITLAYTTKDQIQKLPDIPQVPVTFGAVSCVVGDERSDYPLIGTTVFMRRTVRIAKRIEHRGNEWCVTTEDGAKTLGCHSTKEEAIRQLAAVEIHKRLSSGQRTQYDAESDRIRSNKIKPENTGPHQFKAAKWTFPNGHPRCLRCGSEESISGWCNAPAKDDAVNKAMDSMSIEEDFDERLRNARSVLKATLITTDLETGGGLLGPTQGCSPRDPQCPDKDGRTKMAAPINRDVFMVDKALWTPIEQEWFTEFHKQLPLAGKPLPFVIQAKFSALTEEQMTAGMDVLSKSEGAMTFVLRFATDQFEGHWGIEVKGDKTSEAWPASVPGMIRGAGPSSWMTRSDVQIPMTGDRFVTIERGTYQLIAATADQIELSLNSDRMTGRYFWRKVGPTWLLEKIDDDVLSLTAGDIGDHVAKSLACGYSSIVWPKDITKPSNGHEVLDVQSTAEELTRYRVLRAAPEQRYTLGVAYPAASLDLHQDFMSMEELERTAWDAMRRGVKIGLMHRAGTGGAGTAVESYIYRGPEWKADGQVVKPGDWMLGVVWEPNAWEAIKSGQLKGYSLQGWARKQKGTLPNV